ncbi:MAG TPA: PhzF family phenazine biosynthesis isomerase, partial [Planctomycetota bacterium]|nr:PhzF family phenazine biosynthesis isomerase [Planctomycetota bacterium]
MTIPAAIVDAFTSTAGQGNRAGVVVRTEGLDEAAMRAAAKAVAASETAFLFPGPRLRFFTPAEEIPFCGHATVATIHYLAETGAIPAPGQIEVQCGTGLLRIEIDAQRTVWIDSGIVEWSECNKHFVDGVMECLGADEDTRETSLPVLKSRGKLFIPMTRRQDLWDVEPMWEAIKG